MIHYSLAVIIMHLYIDGESHFVRTEQCVKSILGEGVTLESLTRHQLLVDPRCEFFWDKFYRWNERLRLNDTVAPKRIHFSSCSGDDDLLHTVRSEVRKHDFEPQITREQRQLAKQRENLLKEAGVIEKGKGVDIALAVRMLEDAHRDVFDECLLFTSVVDYIPVIKAVQGTGKTVFVVGYGNGIGKHSELEYIPERFVDLTETVLKWKSVEEAQKKKAAQEAEKKETERLTKPN